MSGDTQEHGTDWGLEGPFSLKDLLAFLKEVGSRYGTVILPVFPEGSNPVIHVHIGPQQIISREDANALVKLFEQLKPVVADVKQTQSGLDAATREAGLADPKAPAIVTAWQKAKPWIDVAIATGTWAAEKATEVSGLVEKIQRLLGSAP